MPELEDGLRLKNWLSIVTFDVFKYAKAGGVVEVEWAEGGLVLRLIGVAPGSEGINAKFRRHVAPLPTPPAPAGIGEPHGNDY